MGESRPRTELDREYREAVTAWLGHLAVKYKITSQEKFAKAFNRNRATVSRYLSGDTRTPLQRLQYLERSLGEPVPPELVEMFYASEPGSGRPPMVDVENDIRRTVENLSLEEQRALLEDIQRRLRRTGTDG